jgi:hypothetical protein
MSIVFYFSGKTPSLSGFFSNSALIPQNYNIGRKKTVSAFQWYMGPGISERVYIGKSTYVLPYQLNDQDIDHKLVKRYNSSYEGLQGKMNVRGQNLDPKMHTKVPL